MTATLPRLGLGLSSNLSRQDVPQPYALLDTAKGLFDFVEYSAPLSLEQAQTDASLFDEMWKRRGQVPVLFHPVHLNLAGPELESSAMLQALNAHALAVQTPWVGNDVGWWHSRGQPFPGYLYVTPPLTAAGLANAEAHARHVQSHLAVPLALENPVVFQADGGMHVLEFLAQLHGKTGAPLILDVGHLWSFQLARGLEATAGLDGFPLDAVIELHIAGGVRVQRGNRAFYADDHTQPIREELFGLLDFLVPRCRHLKALTFEGDGHPAAIARGTLERLRPYAPTPERLPNVAQRIPEPAPSGALHTPEVFWSQFREVHGAAPEGPVADEEGLKAETDFRLAVIAELLDASWPLTRAVLAPARASLVEFATSEGYRALFETGEGTPATAFVRFARESLRRNPREGATRLFAFETWAQGLLRSGASSLGGDPELVNALARGVMAGRFNLDLRETLWAAAGLRRHLSQRAWGSERLEPSGLDGLLQTAERAPLTTSFIGVRWLRERVEYLPLTDLRPGTLEWQRAVRDGWLRA